MTDLRLSVIVAKCARYVLQHARPHYVLNAGDHRGVPGHVLARYIDAYRDATGAQRDEVHALLTKMPGVAYLIRAGSWVFWPRAKAPEEAVRA